MRPSPTVRDGVVESALAHLREGTSVGLLGLPGSGRSTLLERIAAQLEEAGWRAITLRGSAALRGRPLEALAVAGLVPAPSETTSPHAAVAAATDGLVRVIEPGRTVVVVDDADELDAESVGAVAGAVDRTRTPVLSAATRGSEPTLSLEDVARAVRLPVPALSSTETARLVEGACRGPIDRGTAARVHERAGGLPALVIAITENALRHDLLRPARGLWSAPGDLWTPELGSSVEPYRAGLPSEALDALTTLALIGELEVPVARHLVGWRALETLDHRGLLSFTPGAGWMGVVVSPPLLAEHIRREPVGARRLRLIEAVTTELGRDGDDARWGFAHANACARPLELGPVLGADAPWPHDWARALAERRRVRALVRRAEWEDHRDARTAIAFARAVAYRGADPAEAHAALEGAVAADARERAELAVARSFVAGFGSGDLDGALRNLRDADTAPWTGATDAAARHLRLFLDRAPADGPSEPFAVGATRIVRGEELVARGRPREALAEFDAAGDTPGLGGAAGAARALALVLAGDLATAEAHASRAYREAASEVDPDRLLPFGYVLTLLHMLRGDDQGLRGHLAPLLAGAVPVAHAPFELGVLAGAARAAARSGQAASAHLVSERAESCTRPIGPFPLMGAAYARAHAELAAGAASEQAADALWRHAEELRAAGYAAAAVVAGVGAVELSAQPARAEAVGQAAAAADSRLLTLLAGYAAALVAHDPDTQATTGEELLKAGLHGYGLSLLAAAARGFAATAPERAADTQRHARRIAAKLGGEYPRIVDPVPPRSALTAREREVAELAARGMTNQEVATALLLSVRTVENHLHRAFQKLGVGSRSELGEALRAIG